MAIHTDRRHLRRRYRIGSWVGGMSRRSQTEGTIQFERLRVLSRVPLRVDAAVGAPTSDAIIDHGGALEMHVERSRTLEVELWEAG